MNISEEDSPVTNGGETPQTPDEISPSVQGNKPIKNDETASMPPSTGKPAFDFDFSRMEDDVAAFKRELDALKAPTFEQAFENEPKELIRQAPRRRRRTGRGMDRFNTSELNLRLESIIQRSTPTIDFFLFAFLSGCILGAGYLLDAPAILIIGIFISPILGPWVGTALAGATGDTPLFRQTLGGMLTALAAVFFTGLAAGFLGRFFQPQASNQVLYHARLWWPELFMLVLGTVAIIITYVQTDNKPIIPSLMLAYEIFLPVSAAGFGLGSGISGLWPDAGFVLLVHLMLSLIVSLMVFFYMGFRPMEARGYILTAIMAVLALFVLSGFAGLGNLINMNGNPAISTATQNIIATATRAQDTATISFTQTLPATTPSSTPLPASATRPAVTATQRATSTLVPSPESTLVPTPFYGKVQASSSDGVLVRIKPGNNATIVGSAQNGYLVEILNDTPIIADKAAWIHVKIEIKAQNRIIDGWVLRELILTATPSFSP